MSFTKSSGLNDEDILSSQSSDEKMDTGSESFRSQDTPSSVLSFEDKEIPVDNVLRLQNPEADILRISSPENDNLKLVKNLEINDSLITKMSMLDINSPKPKNLGISLPKMSSILTLTTNHPLMGFGSPDENYPDLIPKTPQKTVEDPNLSSLDEEKVHENISYDFFEPQRNTSKSNLYFSENFVTAESQLFTDSILDNKSPPDVARIEKTERRKIVPHMESTNKYSTPPRNLNCTTDSYKYENAMNKYLKTKSRVLSSHSTPKVVFSENIDVPDTKTEEFHSGIAEWCESPSHLRTIPNFDLPMEMTTQPNIGTQDELESPDVLSSSTQGSRSGYQAVVEPHTGRVALRHTTKPHHTPQHQRRRIQIPPEDDGSSSDDSICSLESDHEPATPRTQDKASHSTGEYSREESRRSSATLSEYSDPIPEYSAAEERHDERAWLAVPQAGGRHAKCDIKVIEPYRRVVSHGGYDSSRAAVIVFSACHLPDKARPDYRYVMDNLFLYVIWTLERLVTEDYVLVYLHGSAGRRRLPSCTWLHHCYTLIDRRIRKSLKHLYLVHPTFWLKSFVILTKPFVSTKFFRKLSYVKSLAELSTMVKVDPNAIPEMVKRYDESR